MDNIPLVIGYALDRALQMIGEGHNVIIDSTSTPFEDKNMERQGNSPIVVRQKVGNEGIKLTTSIFK
ncbi:MAG: hypothetical protein VB106_00090 [Clostridiaceae bacterium]|nr:hypothetical protein [Clostridiaceae bacterium]